MKTKICSKCGINKPLEDYNLEPRMSDGRRSNCKVCKAKTDKSYKAKNQEKVKERLHKYYVAHAEKAKESANKWQASHPVERKICAKISQQRHPENGRRATKKWRLAHPERHVEAQRNYRAKKKNSVGKVSTKEFRELVEQYDFRCLKCGLSESALTEITMDHVIPISRGGDNVIENIQPLCRNCNSSKYTKILDYRFGLSED